MDDSKKNLERFTYCLTGKVLPERAVVGLPLCILVKSSISGSMPEGWEVTISIVNSQVSATLTTLEIIADLDDMRERVEGAVRFCVDAMGFLLVCGYDVELIQVTSINPILHKVFGVDISGVRERVYSEDELLAQFIHILQVPKKKQKIVRRALVDFREAIRSHEDTAFFCFRAIEDLRQYFVSSEDNDVKKTWEKMSQMLDVPSDIQEYIWKTLRPLAIPSRHGSGDGSDIDRNERVKMLKAASDMIMFFISKNIE